MWRTKHQNELADALARQNNSTRQKIVENMTRIEEQRRKGRISKFLRNKLHKSSVTRIFYVKEGTEIHCDTQQEIVQACTIYKVHQQTQSESTPFMYLPLSAEAGYMAEKEASEQIFEGTYEIPSSVDKYTKSSSKNWNAPASSQKTKSPQPFLFPTIYRDGKTTGTDSQRRYMPQLWTLQSFLS